MVFFLGMISGAIMLSGNPLNQWALARTAVSYGQKVAAEFGIDTTNSRVMVESLKNIPTQQLQQVAHVLFQKVCIVIKNRTERF